MIFEKFVLDYLIDKYLFQFIKDILEIEEKWRNIIPLLNIFFYRPAPMPIMVPQFVQKTIATKSLGIF